VVGEGSKAWLNLNWGNLIRPSIDIPNFPRLSLKGIASTSLLVRSNKNSIYLYSTDGSEKMKVEVSDELPFDKIADNYLFAFEKAKDGYFYLVSRNPRITIKDERY